MGVLTELAKGLRVTLSQMFRARITTEYPKEHRVKPQRFHGRHVLNRYPDGMEKCIGCELCAEPARLAASTCAGPTTPRGAVSPGERCGYIYEINMLRCIFCGLCVEACPTEAITMSQLFEMSTTNRDDAIYTRDAPDGHRGHRSPHVPLRSAGRPVRAATARWVAASRRRVVSPIPVSPPGPLLPVSASLPLNRRRIGRTTTEVPPS